MKVIFCRPNTETHFATPPLGLGYLASAARSAGHEVGMLDGIRYGTKDMALLEHIETERPDVLCMTTMTSFYNKVIGVCRLVRNSGLRLKIILGGPHASALPRQTLEETGADFVVIGEGERTIVELLESMETKKDAIGGVAGIAYLKEGKGYVETRERELIGNLDEVEWPAWDLMPPRFYPPAPHGTIAKNFPIAPIVTSRGCPFKCSFCTSGCIWKRKLRLRSPENVADEIGHLVKSFGVREIHVEDDNFTLVREHAVGVCKEILERKIEISWACPNGVRVDTLDSELLGLMKESGCYLLAFGIESGSERMLKMHSKAIDKEKIRSAVKMCKSVGIETLGFFILGLPGETKKTIDETIAFSKELGLDRAQFSLFVPLPGSELWEKLQKEGKVSADWDLFTPYDIACSTDGFTKEELLRSQKRAMREFYMRPKTMLNMAKYLKPNQLGWVFKRILDYGFL